MIDWIFKFLNKNSLYLWLIPSDLYDTKRKIQIH